MERLKLKMLPLEGNDAHTVLNRLLPGGDWWKGPKQEAVPALAEKVVQAWTSALFHGADLGRELRCLFAAPGSSNQGSSAQLLANTT